MEKIKCNGCHYEHCCPMAGAGFGYFTMDVCPYIQDEHSKASNPAKVVFTKNDLQCLIEAIVNDCNVGKEDIVEVLEGVLKSVRGENSATDSKRGLEQCCLKVFGKKEDFIDLGLPSGTLWAKCNLGAEKETDFGYFFQWGETEKYKGLKQFNWNDYKFGSWKNLTKYNNTDDKLVLDNDDDPVYVATDGKMKTPTEEQLQELMVYTNHEWIENFKGSGVNGMKFWKKGSEEPADSDPYIFIPAAGYCDNLGPYGVGSWGCVWSSSRNSIYPYGAWYMYFDSGYVSMNDGNRCNGYSVRGVVVLQAETFDEIDDTDDGQPVDLGLPSGTKWMKSNVGATKPSDFGKFYQWGDTQGYSNVDGHEFNWDDYKFGNYNSLTKYNDTDRLTLLEPSDDAATGGGGSIPTKDQLQELIDNTEHRWLRLANGVNGMKFWKKGTEEPTDGDSYIFIPAAGDCFDGSHYDVGSWGNVWSASRNESSALYAWRVLLNAGDVGVYDSYRYYGCSVRGVIRP